MFKKINLDVKQNIFRDYETDSTFAPIHGGLDQ